MSPFQTCDLPRYLVAQNLCCRLLLPYSINGTYLLTRVYKSFRLLRVNSANLTEALHIEVEATGLLYLPGSSWVNLVSENFRLI